MKERAETTKLSPLLNGTFGVDYRNFGFSSEHRTSIPYDRALHKRGPQRKMSLSIPKYHPGRATTIETLNCYH